MAFFDMKMTRRLLAAAFPMLLLPSCAGIPGESPENMRQRMERQDRLVERRQEKRAIRSEAADRRWNNSWDRAMGRSPSGW